MSVDLINQVPHEIFLHVLGFCDEVTLGKVAIVCKKWWQLSGDDSLWQAHLARRNMPFSNRAISAKSQFTEHLKGYCVYMRARISERSTQTKLDLENDLFTDKLLLDGLVPKLNLSAELNQTIKGAKLLQGSVPPRHPDPKLDQTVQVLIESGVDLTPDHLHDFIALSCSRTTIGMTIARGVKVGASHIVEAIPKQSVESVFFLIDCVPTWSAEEQDQILGLILDVRSKDHRENLFWKIFDKIEKVNERHMEKAASTYWPEDVFLALCKKYDGAFTSSIVQSGLKADYSEETIKLIWSRTPKIFDECLCTLIMLKSEFFSDETLESFIEKTDQITAHTISNAFLVRLSKKIMEILLKKCDVETLSLAESIRIKVSEERIKEIASNNDCRVTDADIKRALKKGYSEEIILLLIDKTSHISWNPLINKAKRKGYSETVIERLETKLIKRDKKEKTSCVLS